MLIGGRGSYISAPSNIVLLYLMVDNDIDGSCIVLAVYD